MTRRTGLTADQLEEYETMLRMSAAVYRDGVAIIDATPPKLVRAAALGEGMEQALKFLEVVKGDRK